MDPLENSLSTLRRTHFALFASAVAILLLVAPSGPDFSSALEELSVLREVLGYGGYRGHCAALAHERYEKLYWQQISPLNEKADKPIPVSDNFGLAGVVGCPTPKADEGLEAYADFFLETQMTQVASSLDAGELHEELSRIAPSDPRYALDSLFILIDVDETSLAVQGQDTFRMQFRRLDDLSSADSFFVSAQFRQVEADPARGSWMSRGFMLAGGIALGRSFDRPLDWLSTTSWGYESLAENRDGQDLMFPRLQPFWEEIRTLSLSEAVRYLQARADEQQSNVEVLELEIRTDLVAWAGPLLLLAILLYLFVQLGHLARLTPNDPSATASYPWIGLFGDPVSVSLAFLSLVILPALASAVVSVRTLASSPLSSVWAAAVAVACVVIGYRAFGQLRALRTELGSSG